MPDTLTGGKVNYYLVRVENPQRADQAPYQAECEDLIHALGLTFDEGCLFKALWRRANARKGNGKPGTKDKYDAEKMVHYAGRILKHITDDEKNFALQSAFDFARQMGKSDGYASANGARYQQGEALGIKRVGMTTARADEYSWINWDGGDPARHVLTPTNKVYVRYRSGKSPPQPIAVKMLRWDHQDRDGDIVAYKRAY